MAGASRPDPGSSGRPPSPLLEVGHVVRPHGLDGDVIVELITDQLERLDPGTALLVDSGSLSVVASRPHQHRFIVRFDGIADRAAADRLRGAVLRAEPLDVPGALWAHEVIGRVVVLPDGQICGRVEAVQANPADDLLVLDTGPLVPVALVVGWDRPPEVTDADRRLVIDPPEGLLDL
jgi:16S rRNA processing protein RimM